MHWLADRYQLGDRLGGGISGTVYRAYDRLTGQVVALKRLTQAAISTHANSRQRLAQEFSILAALRHPHIVKVFDYGFGRAQPGEPLQPFFTMELLDGSQTITEATRSLSQADRLHLLLQVLQALTYLHRCGVLHRDLKPSNILVDADGMVRLIDFGLASASHHDAPDGAIAYMAPELLSRHAGASVATDLYALGITAYELLTGQQRAHTCQQGAGQPKTGELIVRMREERIDWSAFDPSLADALARLTAHEPADRFPDAQTAAEALCAAVGWPAPQETDSQRESFLQSARLIGRTAELAQLQDALRQTLAGHGSFWLIAGESGVGKSRLIEALRTRAQVAGALVVSGQAVQNGEMPYRVWREPLRRLVLSVPLEKFEAGALKPLIPDIDDLLGCAIEEASSLGTQSDAYRLLMNIRSVIIAYCNPDGHQPPLVILLEDLHWAKESLKVLEHISALCKRLPLLIVGTYRDDEARHLDGKFDAASSIRLNRLNDAEIVQFSEAMLGAAGHAPALLDLLRRETEGNAFFIVELVRALAEQAGSLAAIAHLPLPDQVLTGGMRQIIHRRLARLPEQARTLLKLAAVVGREIDEPVLRELFSRLYPDEALADMQVNTFRTRESVQIKYLMASAAAGVLELQRGQWRFTHDKIREALLSEISAQERPTLYRIAAEVIETIYPGTTHTMTLMQQWRTAGNVTKELHYAQLVAHQYIALSRYRELRKLCHHVLEDHAAHPDTNAQGIFLDHLAHAHFALSDYDRAQEQYIHNLEFARITGDPRREAAALYGLGIIAEKRGAFVLAVRDLNASLDIRRQLNDAEGMAAALLALGIVYCKLGNLDQARHYLDQSIALRQHMGVFTGVARAHTWLGTVAAIQRDFATAHHHLRHALSAAEKDSDRMSSLAAHNHLGWVMELQHDFDGAVIHYTDSLALAEEIGSLWDATNTRLNLLFVRLQRGQLEQIPAHLHDILGQATDLKANRIVLEALIAHGLYWTLMGEAEEAAQLAGLILEDPLHNTFDVRSRLDLLLRHLTVALPHARLDDALARGRDLSTQDVIGALLHA